MYKIIYEKCETAAVSGSNKLIQECRDVGDEVEFLLKVEAAWKAFQRHYNLLESLFLYLDRVYIVQQEKQSGSGSGSHFVRIKRFGINFFRSFYLMNSVLIGRQTIEKVMRVCETIRRESHQPETEHFRLAGVIISMLRELEEYSETSINGGVGGGELEFENFFLQGTWKFYEQESQQESSSEPLCKYLKYCATRLCYEGEVVGCLVSPITRDKLLRCVRERLICDRMGHIFPKPMGTSLRNLFLAGDMESLSLVYDLINRVFAVETTLAPEWTAFIRLHGLELMSRGNDYRTIAGIARFKRQIDGILVDSFGGDPVLQGTLKDAFETIMNVQGGDRAAELLALYIHQGLRNGTTDESFLSMALLLFRYLHRKEVFDAFYKRTLAQRLLFTDPQSQSLATERQFINKLREECGGGFVSRMEGMLKDVEHSGELTKSFMASCNNSRDLSSVTRVTVISGLWPTESHPNTTTDAPPLLPSQLSRLETAFGHFYTGHRKNCSLRWLERMSSCVMRATFASGRFDLLLTAQQALLVLKFNSTAVLRVDEQLSRDLRMSVALLRETLNSLSDPLYPLLLREGEAFRLNDLFCCDSKIVPLYALQSPFLSLEEEIVDEASVSPSLSISTVTSKTENANLNSIADRQYHVDSLLVRRMKMQTKSTRRDLVNFVLSNIGSASASKISPSDVENRIDGLIEKEFMKSSTDGKTLTYLP